MRRFISLSVWSVVVPLFAGGLATQQGCSALTNATAVQCTSGDECLRLGPEFADTTCDAETKTCKKISTAAECTTNAECSTRKGAGTICRKSDLKCVKLTSDECQNILGLPENVLDDNAIIIGALTPVGSGELGDAVERGVALGQVEFTPTTTGTGLPTKGGKSRPLVIVSCKEFNSDGLTGLLAAANHLVKDLQVPLIIGPIDPTDAQIVLTNVTLPNKVLSILTASITSNLDTLPNPIAPTPLSWRLNYSDTQAVNVLQSFINQRLIPKMQADGTIKKDVNGKLEDARIAIVSEGDFKGKAVARVVQDRLTWNVRKDNTGPADCLDNLNHFPPACILGDFGSLNDTIGNPSPEAKISDVLGAVFTNRGSFAPPHIIIHSYATFGVQRVFFPIEGAWDDTPAAGFPRPYHIGLFGPWNTFAPMFGFMDARPGPFVGSPVSALSKRNFGLYARTGVAQKLVDNFELRFKNTFQSFRQSASPRDVLIRQAYDAVYLAAFAIAALNDKPVTGENLAATLPRLIQGQTIQVGPDDISAGFAALSRAEQGINLEGLSGSLDLNVVTGSPKYSLEISCPGLDASGKTTNFVPSGYYYDEGISRALGTLPGNCPTLKGDPWP